MRHDRGCLLGSLSVRLIVSESEVVVFGLVGLPFDEPVKAATSRLRW